jgi:hypothetical protein
VHHALGRMRCAPGRGFHALACRHPAHVCRLPTHVCCMPACALLFVPLLRIRAARPRMRAPSTLCMLASSSAFAASLRGCCRLPCALRVPHLSAHACGMHRPRAFAPRRRNSRMRVASPRARGLPAHACCLRGPRALRTLAACRLPAHICRLSVHDCMPLRVLTCALV